MTLNSFKITFQIVKDDRVRVFLNDRAVGYLRIHEVRAGAKGYVTRLTYRASSSPFKNVIPTCKYTDFETETVESLLTNVHVYRHVCAAVVRSHLYNSAITELPLHQAA